MSGLNISNSVVEYVVDLVHENVEKLELNLNGLQLKDGFGKMLAEKLNSFTRLRDLRVSLIMSTNSKEVDEFFSTHKPSAKLTSLHMILIGN